MSIFFKKKLCLIYIYDTITIVMKTSSEIIAPVYLQLYAKNGLETDTVISELTALAAKFQVDDLFQLEGLAPSLHDSDRNIIYISVTVIPSINNGHRAVEYIQAIFENFFNNYPKYTEPI